MGLISGSLLPFLFALILGNDEKVKYYTEVVEQGIQDAINFQYPTNAYSYKPTEKETHGNCINFKITLRIAVTLQFQILGPTIL